MNWDQAADVIPDLLKLELVRSDDRFSTGLKEVLHVGSNQDAMLELKKSFKILAKMKEERKVRLKRKSDVRKAEKANEEAKEKVKEDVDWTPSIKK
ncbi:unnamed protein product [Oikopleura dioica]|uniref:Uncharacterized protein n=1 Tax=Oikopleura dioica TaxID=34765 RepID=E4XLW1_OIKDI|nr:unnamed protein product [Oikopleura dioica]CBY38078.1 unnamed protein product [Oikopleura dioica]CBY41227.1 unnamed protein product [Oikopleura dioica]